MDIFLLPLTIMGYLFLVVPFMALVPAAIFSLLYRKSHSWLCLIAAGSWLLYMVYEYGMYLRILCTGECNIRIDLLLIYPYLLLMSLLAIIGYLSRRKRQQRTEGSALDQSRFQ
jgi:hypothetical protein